MNIAINENINNADMQSAVAELYGSYARKLLLYTRRHYSINEDDAMDLVYKTIYRMAMVKDRYSFENEHKRAAFIFKTHINYLRNYFRDNKAFEAKHAEVSIETHNVAAKEEVMPDKSLHLQILQQRLDKLEAWERILLLMRGQDLPYSEIARFVNRPEKHLKVYYARLKKQMLDSINHELNRIANEKK